MARLSNHALAKMNKAFACGYTKQTRFGPFAFLREHRKTKRTRSRN